MGAISTYLALDHLGVRPRILKFMRTPRYSFVSSSSVVDSSLVTFKDDLAPGMRAFVEYGGRETEMFCTYVDDDSANFSIPREALVAGKFTVWAVDRHGNESRRKELHALDGIVVKKKPY